MSAEEDAQLVEAALYCADTGSAHHWPTAAGYLADEVRRLRAQVATAWDEGYEASAHDEVPGRTSGTQNPYRLTSSE